MTYQPGEYETTNQYFSKDTIERINKKNERRDSNYKSILDNGDSKDSISIENSTNNFSIETKSKLINSSNESIITAKTQESHRNQRKIAAEAGFGLREPSEAHIQINLQDSSTNLEYKENSRTHLTITSRNGKNNSRNFGTLKKGATLSRPERQLTTRRRNIMRSENELPPMVRTGATSEKNNIDNPIIQQKHVSKWEKISISKLSDYKKIIEKYKFYPNDLKVENDQLLVIQIDKDLPRTRFDCPFFQQKNTNNEKETNYDVLRRILFYYSHCLI